MRSQAPCHTQAQGPVAQEESSWTAVQLPEAQAATDVFQAGKHLGAFFPWWIQDPLNQVLISGATVSSEKVLSQQGQAEPKCSKSPA